MMKNTIRTGALSDKMRERATTLDEQDKKHVKLF